MQYKTQTRDVSVHTAKRIQMVAHLKLRYGHWGSGRIAQELAKTPALHNPLTKKPYDDSTIRIDLQGLRAAWRAEALRDFTEVQEQHLASIREARGEAWQQGDIGAVLRALRDEADMLGLNAPEKKAIEQTGPGGGPVQVEIRVVYDAPLAALAREDPLA